MAVANSVYLVSQSDFTERSLNKNRFKYTKSRYRLIQKHRKKYAQALKSKLERASNMFRGNNLNTEKKCANESKV